MLCDRVHFLTHYYRILYNNLLFGQFDVNINTFPYAPSFMSQLFSLTQSFFLLFCVDKMLAFLVQLSKSRQNSKEELFAELFYC